jgi:hypothetical protein
MPDCPLQVPAVRWLQPCHGRRPPMLPTPVQLHGVPAQLLRPAEGPGRPGGCLWMRGRAGPCPRQGPAGGADAKAPTLAAAHPLAPPSHPPPPPITVRPSLHLTRSQVGQCCNATNWLPPCASTNLTCEWPWRQSANSRRACSIIEAGACSLGLYAHHSGLTRGQGIRPRMQSRDRKCKS